MTTEVTLTVARRAQCGEGPLWDPASQCVVWVDIVAGEILTTAWATRDTTALTYPTWVGAAAPRAGGGYVGAVTTGFVGLDETGAPTRRADCLTDGIRMNDAKVDPAGVYWAGSCAMDFAAGQGALWRLDEGWNPTRVMAGLTQPNGLGWSPDGRTMYLVDTQWRQVLRFGFDPQTSAITDPVPTVLVDADQFPQYPDGLAVDRDGHLWIAEYAGGAVYEFDAAGRKLRTVPIPTSQPTSVAFVGPQRDALWVTSAAAGLEDDPLAGSIFEIVGHGTAGCDNTPPFRG